MTATLRELGVPPQQIPGLVSDRPLKTGLRPCSGSFLTLVMLGIVFGAMLSAQRATASIR